jgi:uncharacterized membrane protein
MTVYLAALLLGVVAGLRTMTPPAAVGWYAHLGWLDVAGTRLEFLASRWTTVVLSGLALAELVIDQLPSTPRRTIPFAFIARIVSGGLCGAALGAVQGSWIGAAAAGMAGAVAGTLGGLALRLRLAKAFGKDPPAAFLEDAVALGGAAAIGLLLL